MIFAEFIQNHRLDDIIHYDRFLLSWAQAFGKAKIKVAVYEPRYLKQQGLIADFCSRTGITLRDNMSLPQGVVNARLSPSLLEVKRRLNRLRLTRKQHELLLTSLINNPMARQCQESMSPEHVLMSAESRQSLLDRFREGNRTVAGGQR